MRRKPMLAALLLVALALGFAALAAGGTAGDPLVSLSYLREIYTKKVQSRLSDAGAELSQAADAGFDAALAQRLNEQLGAATAERVAARVLQKLSGLGSLNTATMRRVTLSRGDRVSGQAGTGIVLQSGSAELYGSLVAEILNLTLGGVRSPGPAVTPNYYYMLTAADGSGIRVTSDSAEVLVRDGATVYRAYTPAQESRSDTLRELGLFVGTNHGYELDRPPTRQEALIMLVRLLGEETAALAHTAPASFKDLTGWAEGRRYIAYAQAKSYANGESATAFAQYKFATLEMYLSFTLRALGYSDTAGDFVWNTTSKDLSVRLGLLTQAELDGIARTGFMRDHVVLISSKALAVPIKGGAQTLGEKLVGAGAITAEQLAWARDRLR